MWVLQNITLHRETKSADWQTKIRFAFHFVERNNDIFKAGPFPRNRLKILLEFPENRQPNIHLGIRHGYQIDLSDVVQWRK